MWPRGEPPAGRKENEYLHQEWRTPSVTKTNLERTQWARVPWTWLTPDSRTGTLGEHTGLACYIPRDISSLGLRGRQQTPVWQGCGGRAQGAHVVPLGPPPAQNLGCKWPCRPPFAYPGHSGFPPALRSDQRGTEHGSRAFRQPRTCPSEPWLAHLTEGRRHPVSLSRAAAWGSGRVSKGGARSPVFCPHLTATSDHMPGGPSALLTSQKATMWCWTVSRWAWPSPSHRG